MTASTIPDTDRSTTYVVVSPTVGPLSVGFDIFCDDDDLADAAIEVWDDGVKLTPTTHYTVGSASSDDIEGMTRPITDAEVTFTSERSGTIIIIGARRPRRPVGYDTGAAIPASKHNLSINDVYAMLRELWDLRDRMFLAKAGQAGGTVDTLTASVVAGYTVTEFMQAVLLVTDAATARTALGLDTLVGGLPQGRLTLTSGTAITTSDVTGATVCYYTPGVGGNMIPIYNGSEFVPTQFSELSNDTTASSTGKAGPAAVAASKVYFMMAWNDSGTIRLTRSPAWTNDTTVGTGAGTAEIELVKGLWVNKVAITNGPAAQRGLIVGAVRSNASSQLTDSKLFRYVSNIYNTQPRPMRAVDTTDSWNYTTATWRQANASTANEVNWLHALDGSPIEVKTIGGFSNTNAPVLGLVSIGIDSTTAPVSGALNSLTYVTAANTNAAPTSEYKGFAGQGKHRAVWLEYAEATGTATWVGDGGAALVQTGINGWVMN